ncbi:MAG: DEAD/DEAH box helicase, partial [Fusobacterium sp.]|nr:DEAD/DEAH box helicase [Fusobacterium sp.]
KTEVAMRAAFKAIMNQKQVALLVPTTVLAEQHYERFKERFLNYPINIEIVSRVQTKKEQEGSLENLKKGITDLIIGTHRLLSDDIKFKDLGLLIIDEEQKFGVKAKEKLKKIKGTVNILTLTATPIPRTLNLSLLGIRDLSLINTPPEGRLKIKTTYIENSPIYIKEAIMKEIAREGQVFYVYNRVKRIEEKKKEIKELLPSYVNVEYIHGQMTARDIKRTLTNFENGNIDILISTIIIENGIDVENANTMIIDGVEKLGLSQIYQLRGRIGRSSKQSYCYLLMNDNKTKKAEKREESIKKFDESSGLELSMEDIKIRGVGEILGEKQHGAVETFGYNLYMKMLKEEIDKIKGNEKKKVEIEDINIQIDFPKFIPDSYIEKNEKIKIYKRALLINDEEKLKELYLEVKDRFGKPPKEAEGFFKFLKIKLKCKKLGITEVIEKDKKLYISFLEEKVDVNRILDLIKANKISYLKNDKKIIFSGNILTFFKIYD